ncbi:hypothetical protein [Neptuniibacter sp. QD37_11]|uniref:hypothetical protein n=1 Tax=Neptuniibacter sp. QD37_11 TaxID=3398209 RepID=UPI0039F51451
MSKHITPAELAEIVTALLVDPDAKMHMNHPEEHSNFIQDIARAVALRCGGDIVGVSPLEDFEQMDDGERCSALVSVYPDGELPSLRNNIWSPYDGQDDWEMEQEDADALDIPLGRALTDQDVKYIRTLRQSMLIKRDFKVPFIINDGAGSEGGEPVYGNAVMEQSGGLSLCFEGYTDHSSEDDCGFPVFVEVYDGQLQLRAYADVNCDDPTHVISLEGASNQARVD